MSDGFGTPNGRAFTFNTATGAWGEKSPVVLEHLSAASEAEVWALDTSFEIVKWNEGSASWQAFPDHAVPLPPQAPVAIEATPSDRLWIVTGAGEIYRYLP